MLGPKIGKFHLGTWVAIFFVIFYLLSSPTDAAHVVNNAFGQLGTAGNQLAKFVNALGK